VNGLRRALIGLAVAGIVIGVLMAVLIATSDHVENPAVEAVLSLLVSWSFFGTGLAVWDRSPSNLIGPLMVAFSFAWFLSNLTASNLPGLFAAGLILSTLPYGVLATCWTGPSRSKAPHVEAPSCARSSPQRSMTMW
jgi:hypothetical protein